MSKTDLKKVNWTPVIDSIVNKHGYMAALVFGAIWRHCQMSGKACTASLDTIAKMIGVERKTIIRYADILADDGYITRFKTSGKPTTYRDTGKAGVKVEVVAYDEINDTRDLEGQGEEETSPIQVLHQSHTGTTPVPLRDLNNSIKDSIKETICDVSKSETSQRAKEKKGDFIDAMIHYQKPSDKADLVNSYPEDIRKTLQTFLTHWPLDNIPDKRSKSQYSWWIKDLREINKACGEFGLDLLNLVYKRWNETNFTVANPGAIIKTVYSEAAKRRKSGNEYQYTEVF